MNFHRSRLPGYTLRGAHVAWAFGALVGCEPEQTEFSGAQLDAARERSPNVEPDRLAAHVQGLVDARAADTVETVSWYPEHDHTHIGSAEYVLRYCGDDGRLAVTVEDSDADGMHARNIVIDIPGTRAPDEVVLLSAHFDAWFAGADDNASGVAVALEAARILAAAPVDRSVRIALFDLEEYGLVGSNRFLQVHGVSGIVGGLNLDAVGFASRERGSQKAPLGLAVRDVGDFIAVIANDGGSEMLSQVARLPKALPIPLELIGILAPGDGSYPGTADFLRSDHAPFWRAGIPLLFVTDTASFRNERYHTTDDVPSSLDAEFFARTAELVVGAVSALGTLP